MEQYLEEYKKSFENALLDMKISFQIGDVDGMIDGANQITKKLGGIVKYGNIDEFKGLLKSKQIDVL